MINKTLNMLEEDKKEYENNLENTTVEEKDILKKEFIKNLRLYLLEANKLITETFNIKLSPFQTSTGYNALYKGSAESINKKTFEEFLIDINNLIHSDIYINLELEKKKYIDIALYIIKTYYKNNLD